MYSSIWRLVVLTLLAVISVAAPADASSPRAASGDASDGARNVIVFISDGAGPEQYQLGRLYSGGRLAMDTIPWSARGTLDTGSLDGVTDSAAAATALAAGRATHNGWLSMVPSTTGPLRVRTALEVARAHGKWVGLITDVAANDATPAAFAAHVTDRTLTVQIARQIGAHRPQVLFGGKGSNTTTPLQSMPGVTYVSGLDDLRPYLTGVRPWVSPLYGLIGADAMTQDLDREVSGAGKREPTLAQLTVAALRDLSRRKAGFFLVVEGGAIDKTCHARDPGAAGAELQGFDRAVARAYTWVKDRSDTLLVVTSDHETGGLKVGAGTDVPAIRRQSATAQFMWDVIQTGTLSVQDTMSRYAGAEDLTPAEVQRVLTHGALGVSDVLSARDGVSWEWNGASVSGHTSTPVRIRAWGPGSRAFTIKLAPNERVGRQLLRVAAQ